VSRRVTLLGIGNVDMGDDGAGVEVVRRLGASADEFGASAIEGGMGGMGLLRHFLEADALVVVDAIDTGAEPGAIFRFDPDEAGVTHLRSNNIHGMGLPYLLTNARLLGHDPEVVVYAVQVADVCREGLSPVVAKACERVCEFAAEELRRMTERSATA
jgi:hydrogenase maturation protease